MITAAGGTFRGGTLVSTRGSGGAGRFSSLELQLETPKAASSESTETVKAIRAGVHKGFWFLVFFVAGIS